jgi:UDP-N-acetylmuramoyl-L-alanyl-D-glutamate--2,6-diaminopimelate ligase
MNYKKFIPKSVINFGHLFFAWWGSVKYRYPSEEMLVIGITGTSGKSSCVHFLRQILTFAGYKVGSLSTVDFYIAGETTLNDKKMTMLGRTAIQRYLRAMANAGCQIAIVEATSEGAVQHRHRFINFDTIMLTNFYPEHIESHGGFDNYKKAKLSIFEHVAQCGKKKITDLHIGMDANAGEVAKVAVVNGNNQYALEYLQFPFDKKICFGREDQKKYAECGPADAFATMSVRDKSGTHFMIHGHELMTKITGDHTVQNLSGVVAVARTLGISWETIASALLDMSGAPGRIEFIPEAAKKGVQVIVDYAFEPVAIGELYKVVDQLQHERIIHVFGSTGGGRDVSRRSTVGEFVGRHADICIVTDEDPYDDDPDVIIHDVAEAVERTNKKLDDTYFVIRDRREAIAKAWELAEYGDVILITGKGSEQKIVRAGGRMEDWDDRQVVRSVVAENKK